jgi:hypothetical protein
MVQTIKAKKFLLIAERRNENSDYGENLLAFVHQYYYRLWI